VGLCGPQKAGVWGWVSPISRGLEVPKYFQKKILQQRIHFAVRFRGVGLKAPKKPLLGQAQQGL